MEAPMGAKNGMVQHAIVLGIFLIISCIFCMPALQGYYLNQHDMFTWLQGSAESRAYYDKTGEFAQWSNNMFSGMPLVATDNYPNGNWFHKLNHWFQFYTNGLPHNPIVFFMLSMLGFYLLSLSLKINKWLGVIGGIAFAFSTYNPIIIAAGHTTKMIDIAYLPAILAGVIYAYRGKYGLGAIIVAIFLPMFIDTGHFQIIYYGALVVITLVIAAFIYLNKGKQLKQWLTASVILLVIALLSIAVNGNRFVQMQQFSKHTIRGGQSELADPNQKKETGLDKDYAFAWSNGLGETACLLVPNLYGGASNQDLGDDSDYGQQLKKLGVPARQVTQMTANAPTYWGPQPMLSGAVYFGAVICFLFMLSFFVIKSSKKWWVLGIVLFFTILSVGKNLEGLNYFLFDYFPGLNKFRAPTMALAIPSLFFPLMAVWALRDILEDKLDKATLLKALKNAGIVVGGLLVVLLFATQGMFSYIGLNDEQLKGQFGEYGDQVMSALRADRASMALKDTLRSIVFVALAFAALWAYAKDKLSKQTALIAMGLLVVIDLLPVAHRSLTKDRNYLTTSQWEAELKPKAVDKEILKDKDLSYRVYDLTVSPFNDARTALFHKSVGGYHGAKLQIYQDLIENQLGKLTIPVINMLNTRYLIVPGQNNQAMVQRNPGALGNAWFVNELKFVDNARAEMDALNGPSLSNPMDSVVGFDPANVAIVRADKKAGINKTTFDKSNSNITLTAYDPRVLKYDVQAAQDGFVVFSEIFYDQGWTATIDGKEVPIIRTNYVLRGLQMPAGNHKVEFRFELPKYAQYEQIALIGSIVLVLLIIAGVYWYYKKEKQAKDACEVL